VSAATRILTVCTGNIFRSAVAEAALRRRLGQLGVASVLASAGLVTEGAPAPASVVAAAKELLALDLTAHRSRRLAAADVEAADVVIGMAREHVREAVILVPGAWPRSFTLKELVRRAAAAGPRGAGEDLPAWLARLGAGRGRGGMAGASAADDVPDPVGAPPEVLAGVVREIGRLVDELAGSAWPAGAEGDA
jgi:protein-tyrosine phosphatase